MAFKKKKQPPGVKVIQGPDNTTQSIEKGIDILKRLVNKLN